MTASVLLGAATTTTDDAFGNVKDFFHSSAWSLLKNLSIFFLILFWIATAFWVYKDARRRIEDSWLLSVAIAMGIVPFVGPLLYMLFRPPEYLEDVRERELAGSDGALLVSGSLYLLAAVRSVYVPWDAPASG